MKNYVKYLGYAAAAAIAVLGGCHAASGVAETLSDRINDAITQSGGVSIVGLGVLDFIFGVGMLATAGSIIYGLVSGNFPVKLTVGLVLAAIGAAVVKVLLVKFLWLVVILSLLALLFAGAVAMYAHLGFFEKLVGKDLNKNGTVGT